MSIEEIILVLEEWIKRDSKLQNADRLENIEIYNKAIKGLRSLKAWEAVKEEIEEEIIKSSKSNNSFALVVEDVLIHKALDIINKHLKELENDN